MNVLDIVTITISLRGIDLLALKKLSLVNHALAQRFSDYQAREELKGLVSCLDDLVRQIDLACASLGAQS